MKKIAIIALLAGTFSFAGARAQDPAAEVAGKWNIHTSVAGNDSDTTCTFTQTGNDLAGICTGPQGDAKFTGKVDGKKVNWTYDIEYNGSPLTMKYEGTLDSGKVTGTVTVEPFGVTGDFSGAPATAAAPAATPAAAPGATPAAAGSSSVAGKWKVHTSIAGNESDGDCTFTQTENDLTGTCVSEQGSVKITGKVDGAKITWSFNSEYNGSPLTVKYNGTLDAGKMTGDTTVEPFGLTGDFTATQAN